MTQDPVTVFAMAMATNIHIGFVCGENLFWSTHADGDVWKCDILMILAEDTEMFVWRAMHVRLHTWALKTEEDELHCTIRAVTLLPFRDEEEAFVNVFHPDSRCFKVPVDMGILQNLPCEGTVYWMSEDGCNVTLKITFVEDESTRVEAL